MNLHEGLGLAIDVFLGLIIASLISVALHGGSL